MQNLNSQIPSEAEPAAGVISAFSWKSLQVPLAFLTALAIWSTTPLAITMSVGEVPFTSALMRMCIGVAFCGLILVLRARPLPITRITLRLYAISGFSTFIAMSLIYTAAQSIPSGWIAVVFGLSPILTGLFALPFDAQARLTPIKVVGLLLGFYGLSLVFNAGSSFESIASIGLLYVLAAVAVSSASSVAMRHICAQLDMSGMQITTGGLLVAIPLFSVMAFASESSSVMMFGKTEMLAVLYLGLVGTGIGFTIYFFLLKRLAASRVALITLISPIFSLALGAQLNNEPLLPGVWVGAVCVSVGLLLSEFTPKLGLRRL